MSMIEVFKTNVENPEQSQTLLRRLLAQFPQCRINFDLEDCDRVLRVEGENFAAGNVIRLVNEHGYLCEELSN
jgi:hypothetical protein